MEEADKRMARWALSHGRLTVSQVEELRAESDRTGRPLGEIAVARGWLPASALQRPVVPLPPLYAALLGGALVIFAGLLIATLVRMKERSRRDDDLALETEQSRIQADQRGAEAGRGYQRAVVTARVAAAQAQLVRARDAMARADRLIAAGGLPAQTALALDGAFVAYNMYLHEFPDDADVRLERARTHELRRNYDLAIADLARVAELRPARKASLEDRISQLRLLLPRNPK